MPQIMTVESIKEQLKKRLRSEHYEHSVRTAETAEIMAKAYGVDADKAYLAGILHDCAKSMTFEALLQAAEAYRIPVLDAERAYPYLLHAKVGAYIVQRDFHITDKEIIDSIEHHTFGASSMTVLDKIIYVADMIEPGRPYKGLERLREIALDGLDMVFREAYIHTVEFVVRTRQIIHPLTVDVWNSLVAGNHE